MIYFVSRHSGAVAWAEEEGFTVDEQLAHLDPAMVQSGDVVIGSLPVHLAAQVCTRGGRYMHLSMEIPPEWRGAELTPERMRACHARLEAYQVTAIASEQGR